MSKKVWPIFIFNGDKTDVNDDSMTLMTVIYNFVAQSLFVFMTLMNEYWEQLWLQRLYLESWFSSFPSFISLKNHDYLCSKLIAHKVNLLRIFSNITKISYWEVNGRDPQINIITSDLWKCGHNLFVLPRNTSSSWRLSVTAYSAFLQYTKLTTDWDVGTVVKI